ncbi:MAG: hypothetical protein P4L81_07325 [Candidatus Pacebacteria bacterium]|nr:hypothetical protein [Candidatus Paceibacterota bacterium]
MSLTDIIAISANIALTLTFVVGLIFGIIQVKAAERDRRERLTVDILRAFQTREFAEFINFFRKGKLPKSQAEFDALAEREQIMYLQFSQQMESLGILVAENIVDIDLVDKTLGNFVSLAWKRYDARFSEARKSDPFLGEYFQWLAERMSEHSAEFPREPFYLSGAKPAHKHASSRRNRRSNS